MKKLVTRLVCLRRPHHLYSEIKLSTLNKDMYMQLWWHITKTNAKYINAKTKIQAGRIQQKPQAYLTDLGKRFLLLVCNYSCFPKPVNNDAIKDVARQINSASLLLRFLCPNITILSLDMTLSHDELKDMALVSLFLEYLKLPHLRTKAELPTSFSQ